MIPPSVIRALRHHTETDISQLFAAGRAAGPAAMGMYAVTIQIVGRLRPQHMPRGARHGWL